jgi:hypothetical protein
MLEVAGSDKHTSNSTAVLITNVKSFLLSPFSKNLSIKKGSIRRSNEPLIAFFSWIYFNLFCDWDPPQSYKTFYGRYLRISVVS